VLVTDWTQRTPALSNSGESSSGAILAIDGHVAGMGRVLGSAGFMMLELVASSINASRNRESCFALDMVPRESDAAAEGTGPVTSELVLGMKRGKKMVCMGRVSCFQRPGV
jgi:hypothetical protein